MLSESTGLRRTRGSSLSRQQLFNTLAAVMFLVAVAALFVSRSTLPTTDVWPGVIVWFATAAILGLLPVESDQGLSLAVDLPVLLGAGFIFGPFVGGLIALAGSTHPQDIRRSSLMCAVYNRAQTCLSVIAAAYVFRAVGGSVGDWPWASVAALAALAADCSINYALAAVGTSLRSGAAIRSVVRSMKFGSTPVFVVSYAAFGLLGMLFAEMYARLGGWGLAAAVTPMVLARQAFSEVRTVDRVGRALADRSRALSGLADRVADERRDERTRIAEALHDDVLQNLYNVSIHAHVIREDLRSGQLLALDNDLPALLAATEAASDRLREAIRGLRASPIGRGGLIDTLQLLAADLHDQHRDINVSVLAEGVDVPADAQFLIYQVAREALINACSHASPRHVVAYLHDLGNHIQLRVVDDGSGFDPLQVDSERHFGLTLMRERVETSGGVFWIRSEPGTGSTVSAQFPTRGSIT